MRMNQPVNPKIHEAAVKIARRFVHIISALLREEERGIALQEAFQIAVEELEIFSKER